MFSIKVKHIFIIFFALAASFFSSLNAVSENVESIPLPGRQITKLNREFDKDTLLTRITFYNGAEVIAHQVLDIDGNIVEQRGLIPDGIIQEHDEEGSLKVTTPYYNNRPHGVEKTYYRNGQVTTEMTWKEGQLQGLYREFYSDGKLRGIAFYRDGQFNGPCKIYYPDGAVRAEWKYRDNNIEGVYKTYYEDGSLKEIKNYKNGQLVDKKQFEKNNNEKAAVTEAAL